MKQEKIKSSIESLLMAVGKPLSFKEIADLLEVDTDDIKKIVEELKAEYNQPDKGIHITINNNKIQLTSNSDNTKILRDYFQDEATGELSKASLETLTIIAYRQPISKEELEQIRGVNCSIILRNLMIRGLIETKEAKDDLVPHYLVTIDFLRHLGVNSVEELPDFAKLNSDENLQSLLEQSAKTDEK